MSAKRQANDKLTPAGGVFVIQKDGSLAELAPANFSKEEDFQKLLEEYPTLLPGDQVDPVSPRRWVLITRELGIAMEEEGPDRVWLDHLFLDQEGIPTLIEVKRKSDTRARREVVAQMLDYAANAETYLPAQRIRGKFEASHENPEEVLREKLGWSGTGDEFWAAVKTNLEAGRMRLVFVAEKITPELQRIVEFLNRQTDPLELLAVEIPKYEGKGVQALVPRVLGQSLHARDRKAATSAGAKIQWDWESFSAKLKPLGQGRLEAAKEIVDWCGSHRVPIVWMANQSGSFVICPGDEKKYFAAISVRSDGTFSWNAPHQGKFSPPPFDSPKQRKEVLRRLGEVPGAVVDLEKVDGFSALKLDLASLRNPQAMAKFLAVVSWLRDLMSGEK